MQLIVTRPVAQALRWVQELRALGLEARALPLIDIAPASDVAPVVAAWQRLPDWRFIMFVSANAVLHFFALRPRDAHWRASLRAGATGPGTRAALIDAGVPVEQIVAPDDGAAELDSEALWRRLAHDDWQGQRVLVVRGEDGRDWLAERWRGAGAQVHFVAAYRRSMPRLDDDAQRLLAAAQREPAQHLWLFSSSQAVANLRELAPQADWSHARALATHTRIAQTALDAGFAAVSVIAPRPADVAAFLAADSSSRAVVRP